MTISASLRTTVFLGAAWLAAGAFSVNLHAQERGAKKATAKSADVPKSKDGVAKDSRVGKNAAKKDGDTARRRLPPYYAQVVDDEQRAKIYEIQAGYASRKAELKKQLADLMQEETAEIDEVLTAKQREQLAAIKEEAAQARRVKPASGRKSEKKKA